MTWQEFYKFPLMIDEYGGNVIAQPGDMGYRWAFDWEPNSHIAEYPLGGARGEELAKQIVETLNGSDDYTFDFSWSIDPEDPTIIKMDDEPCMCIRGWGELTGTGALHLPSDQAAKIQDDFRDYIINRLNSRKK